MQEHRALLAGRPMTLRVEVRGLGDVLFCHATPRNENESFTRLTSRRSPSAVLNEKGRNLEDSGPRKKRGRSGRRSLDRCRRADVLIDTEQVRRVVLVLDRGQARVIIPK